MRNKVGILAFSVTIVRPQISVLYCYFKLKYNYHFSFFISLIYLLYLIYLFCFIVPFSFQPFLSSYSISNWWLLFLWFLLLQTHTHTCTHLCPLNVACVYVVSGLTSLYWLTRGSSLGEADSASLSIFSYQQFFIYRWDRQDVPLPWYFLY